MKNKKQTLTILEVNSWKELSRSVDEARRLLAPDPTEEIWYRGVSDREYKLLPSLFRVFKEKSHSREEVRTLESDLFFEFLSRARTENGTGLDHWDVLFLMQHYRVPTRLLDWTEVLNVALYFAIGYDIPGNAKVPRIYVMNPYSWNENHHYGRDLFWPRYFGWDAETEQYYEYGEILIEGGADWQYPVALYPPQREARLSAQRGFFSIHGFDPRPLDEIAPPLIVAIDLKEAAVQEVKEVLNYGGVTEYSLFPDLEGLSRTLRKKYGIN